MSDRTDDTGAAILDRTRSEDWARLTPRTSDVLHRATALRRRRTVGTPVGVMGLATVLAGGVALTGLGPSHDTGASPGAAGGTTVTATRIIKEPTVEDGSFQKVLEGSVVIGAGTLGSHAWSVKVAVFPSAAELKKIWPPSALNNLPDNLPATGPVYVSLNTDHQKPGGMGVTPLPAQPPAIPEGKPSVVDPWYAANLGVVTAVVDPRVDHLAITSGGTTTNYPTHDVRGFRFITFPITGPGDVTKIVAYDRVGTVMEERSGRYLPYGVFPYQLAATDPRSARGTWG